MTPRFFSFDELVRSVGCQSFFRNYWQRRSLAMGLDDDIFARILTEVGPLDAIAKARTARRGVQAWISGPHVLHSVFEADAATIADFHRIGATLYFVDVPVPELTQMIADALGAPRRRIWASLFLTPPLSGASPHFDCNENFTIQLTGAKDWYVESAPLALMPPVGHVLGHQRAPSVKNLIAREVAPTERHFSLTSGKLLYVPRGTVHRTRAVVESWSLNICYSGTMWLELLQEGLHRRLLSSPRWRATVSGASKACAPGATDAYTFPELIGELRQLLDDPKEIEDLCRAFLEADDKS
jgi:ribosomal protein L16 Arg81 hydroxylase